MSLVRTCAVRTLVALIAATCLFAQSNLNQRIVGQVTDATGAAITRAVITILEEGTGLTRKTTTNDNGNYVFAELPTGKYTVTAESPGFKKEVVANNMLNTNVSIEVNLHMQVGSQADAVTIQADASTVETTNGDVGYTVTGEQAGELAAQWPELSRVTPAPARRFDHLHRRLRPVRRLRCQ